MKKNKLKLIKIPRIAANIIVVAFVFLLFTYAYLSMDNIYKFTTNPQTPFQIVTKPKATNYEINLSGWILPLDYPKNIPTNSQKAIYEYNNNTDSLDNNLSKENNNKINQDGVELLQLEKKGKNTNADIFFIPEIIYESREQWNSNISDDKIRADIFTKSLPTQAGPFAKGNEIFAPIYRAANIYSFFTNKYDGRAARLLSAEDVLIAFDAYLASANPNRPLVLVAYGQAGLYLQNILIKRFSDPELKKRLVAAYIINQATPIKLVNNNIYNIKSCSDINDTSCLISFIALPKKMKSEAKRHRKKLLHFAGDDKLVSNAENDILCMNPLAWSETDQTNNYAHKGGAITKNLDIIGLLKEENYSPKIFPNLIGNAQCEEGILFYDEPKNKDFVQNTFWSNEWHISDFNIFYQDIKEDVQRRIYLKNQELAKDYSPPLDEIVTRFEIPESPIRKIKN